MTNSYDTKRPRPPKTPKEPKTPKGNPKDLPVKPNGDFGKFDNKD